MQSARDARAVVSSACLLLTLTLAGCTTSELEPAGADPVGGSDTTATSEDGIRLIAQTDAWTGDPDVAAELTPIRLSIDNGSGVPVRLRYDDITLVAADGTTYSVLPPLAVQDQAAEVDRQRPVGPIDPYFGYDGFAVAPYYDYLYPGLVGYDGAFGYDPLYYDTYRPAFVELDVPDLADLRQRALPEGVIRPGGGVSGFVYFERVPATEERVSLHARLVDAASGRRVATLTVPFVQAD